jgi:N-acetylneuraminic acid mutarotase
MRIERRTKSLALIVSSIFRDDRIGSFLATALLLIAVLTLPACGGGSGGNSPPPPATLVSIAVTPNNSNLPMGLTQQLKATGTFSDGSTADLTSTTSWNSSKPAFATVGAASGVATSIALGSTVITATSSASSGSVSGSATLIVTPAALQSISITPNAPSLVITYFTQLIAVGTYSDGTTAKVTTTVNWASTMPSVASVGLTTGMVTAVLLGSTTISATAGSITGTTVLSVIANPWSSTGGMQTPRFGHTATPLSDGKVLVAGGIGNQSPITEMPLASSEIYDPVAGTWTATGSLNAARSGQTATLLPNGKVLVAGGNDFANGVGGGSTLASAEIYDPATRSWTPTANLATARSGHTATLLPDGTVLVVGGSVSTSTEIYEPGTGTWKPAGNLAVGTSGQTATLLPNGTVLVAGGGEPTAEIYDPVAGTWTPTGSLATDRGGHTATLLANGTVLVVGGVSAQSVSLSSAEIYDPATGSWRATGGLNRSRYSSTATLLPSGTVLVVGGDYLDTSPEDSGLTATAEAYNPASGTWTSAGSLFGPYNFAGIDGHTATLLPDGTVLIAGGHYPVPRSNGILGIAEIYN